MNPLVSVVIPVFNSEDFITDCLNSICRQSYSKLEIVIVDDASSDRSLEKIQLFSDSRIRVLKQSENLGLAASVNRGIRESNGSFIARMDADDVSMPDRIEKQVNFLNANPEVDIVGTAMQGFGDSDFLFRFPATHDECKSRLLFNVCFGHPTVLIRRQVFNNEQNFYRPELQQYSEEYELWCRLVDRYRFANLPEVLLKYRTSGEATKRFATERRRINSLHIRSEFIAHQLGIENRADYLLHDQAANLARVNTQTEFDEVVDWLIRLEKQNEQVGKFSPSALSAELSFRLFEWYYANHHLGFSNLWRWYGRKYFLDFTPTVRQQFKFIWRIFVE
jgi:glycosyltransferase involved in cell wall biosynthesis